MLIGIIFLFPLAEDKYCWGCIHSVLAHRVELETDQRGETYLCPIAGVRWSVRSGRIVAAPSEITREAANDDGEEGSEEEG